VGKSRPWHRRQSNKAGQDAMRFLAFELHAEGSEARRTCNKILRRHAMIWEPGNRPSKCRLPPFEDHVGFSEYEAARQARQEIIDAGVGVGEMDIEDCWRSDDGHVHLKGVR